MVPSVVGSPHRHSPQPSGSAGPANPASRHPASLRSVLFGTGCVESERARLLAEGLSHETAQTCLAAKSTSTRKTYVSGWCAEQDADPYSASLQLILNFLQSLFNRGLAYDTVKSRASAIASEHLVYKERLGRFDTLVLEALAKPPFEPLEDVSLKLLTLKTAFLVAMASASKTSELKAFDRRPLLCTISARDVVLQVDQSFRPKVVRKDNLARAMDFAPLVPEGDPPNPALQAVCVVSAIKQYIEVTNPVLQENCTQFFVTFQKGCQGRPASPVTIAHWLKAFIQEAYEHSQLPLPAVRAHSTRKLSTSWAELKHISIRDICQQANWASSNVFVKHYKLNLASSVSARHARGVGLGTLFFHTFQANLQILYILYIYTQFENVMKSIF